MVGMLLLRVLWPSDVRPAGGGKGALIDGGRVLVTRSGPKDVGTALFLSESRDEGRIWKDVATIAVDLRKGMDMGDGNLVQRGAISFAPIASTRDPPMRCE